LQPIRTFMFIIYKNRCLNFYVCNIIRLAEEVLPIFQHL